MKLKQIKKEANIGMNVEFSNIELTVLKTKLDQFANNMLDDEGDVARIIKLDSNGRKDINDVITFLTKLTEDVVSLQEANDELFFDFGIKATDKPIEQTIEVEPSIIHEIHE